ncbi:uncharacterized protein DNG_08842 [Cephalotrichum gorgonifer]|uniref:Uncharacterized protein n=1 Tax=Cephalotrichum gorgonifer TaxID=2041049 RepID=A0AAE8N6C6_9PEZI|nr:uncharacterized protein DNG_08842 [Cephalotrichum gorgonifer]
MTSGADAVPARWDPLITPNQPKWVAQTSIFRSLLAPTSRETIHSILQNHFTRSERLLALPATAPDYLVAAQDENAARYRRLLQGRFRGVEDDAVTRLTMLYFGMPAEPLMYGLFKAVDEDVEMLDGADARIYEVTPPLHFLTAHDRRNWGRDELRGTEAPLSYIPVPAAHAEALKSGARLEEAEEGGRYGTPPKFQSSLRGGGEVDSDDESEEECTIIKKESSSPVAHVQTAPGYDQDDTSGDQDQDQTTENYFKNVRIVSKTQYRLYGYQGSVMFRGTGSDLDRAVRRLLSLTTADNPKIKLINFNINQPRDGLDVQYERFRVRLPLLDGGLAIRRLARHWTVNPKSHENCCALFVCLEHEPDPRAFAPSAEHMAQLVAIADSPELEHDTALAYSRVPREMGPRPELTYGRNLYAMYMRTAMQLVLGRMNEPGENHIGVRVHDNAAVQREQAKACYGGLTVPAEVYSGLSRSVGRDNFWAVSTEILSDDCIALCMPGLEKVRSRDYELVYDSNIQTIPQSKDPRVRHESLSQLRFKNAFLAVEGMLYGALSDVERTRLRCFEVECGYTAWERSADGNGSDTVILDYFAANPDPAQPDVPPEWAKPLANFLQKSQAAGHRFFILRPKFEKYDLVPSWGIPKGSKAQDCKDDLALERTGEETLEAFRGLIDKMLTKTPHPSITAPIEHRNLWIVVECVPLKEEASPVKWVVLPETDLNPRDWNSLIKEWSFCERLVVSLSLDGEADFTRSIDESIPWGPRYGDVGMVNFRRKIWTEEPSTATAPPATPPPATAGPSAATERPVTTTSAKQPSCFDGGPFPKIPVTSPPREPILRTGGPNISMVTTRVLTPTDQQRLQEALYATRNVQLRRALRCHYKDCTFTVAADEQEAMQMHLQEMHVVDRCPWCNSTVFAHMSVDDRHKHMVREHRHILEGLANQADPTRKHGMKAPKEKKARDHVSAAASERQESAARRRAEVNRPQPKMERMVPRAPERAAADEHAYSFCDRCGRDHTKLTDEADREWHDRICVPRAPNAGEYKFCGRCGAREWETRELSHRNEGDQFQWPHHCAPEDGDAFCVGCGISTRILGGQDKFAHHVEHCKGFSGKMSEFCPYCRVSLGYIRDWKVREKHIITCLATIPTDEDGLATEEGAFNVASTVRPYSLYLPRMWVQPGPQAEEDLFYSGWRADMRPESLNFNRNASGPPLRPNRRTWDKGRKHEDNVTHVNDLIDQGQPPPRARSEPPPEDSGKKRPAEGEGQTAQKKQKTPDHSISSSDASEIVNSPNQPPKGTTPHPEQTPTEKTPGQKPSPAAKSKDAAPTAEKSGSNKAQTPEREQGPAPAAEEGAVSEDQGGALIRRRNSPVWDWVLGEQQDPEFVPLAGMYCSRCLRRVPGGKQVPRESDPSWREQFEAHMDPNRSCRIRRAAGHVGRGRGLNNAPEIGLPNRSGWLMEPDVKGKLGVIKAEFKRKYPLYARTVYPMDGKCTNSVWREDPNNPMNEENWTRPWPPWSGTDRTLWPDLDEDPGEGVVEAPAGPEVREEGNGEEEAGDTEYRPGVNDEQEGDHDLDSGDEEVPTEEQVEVQGGGGASGKKKLAKPTVKDNDGVWHDQGEVHSEDEEPHPEEVRADALGEEGQPKKKRPGPAPAPVQPPEEASKKPLRKIIAKSNGKTYRDGKVVNSDEEESNPKEMRADAVDAAGDGGKPKRKRKRTEKAMANDAAATKRKKTEDPAGE